MFRGNIFLKRIFKTDDLYANGLLFINDRVVKDRKEVHGLSPTVRDDIYRFKTATGASGMDSVMIETSQGVDMTVEMKTAHVTIKEIAEINYAIVNKALMKYPIFKFNTLQSYFPNVSSTRQFIMDEEYLGSVRIDIQSRDMKPTMQTMYDAVFYVLGKIATSISGIEETYRGTKEFRARNMREIFRNKTVNYTEPHDGGIGISQNDPSVKSEWKIDLAQEDWFAYTDNFGTSEEKAFVAYFKGYVDDLRKKYHKVYLVRNEREFHIYSFEDGERFEPDYVLLLQKKKTDGYEQIQIFIEPKGTQLLEKDAWKEKFLLQLREEAVPVKVFVDDNDYRIWGFHFFNQDHRMKEFDEEISSLAGRKIVRYDFSSQRVHDLMVAEDPAPYGDGKKEIGTGGFSMAESQNIEYKESWRDEYLKWVCGFANAQGGTIYIGIDDAGNVVGVQNVKKLLEDIPNKIQTVLGIVSDVNKKTKDGKDYVEIRVEPSSYPVNYHGEYHYRSGATKQQLKGFALTEFIRNKTGFYGMLFL